MKTVENPDSIPGRLAAMVRKFSGRVAVVDPGGAEWTYQELDACSARVAAAIREAGVARGSPVALLGDPGAPLVAGIVGVLKSGHPYLCLEPGEAGARESARLRHSGAGLLLAGAPHHDRARELAGSAGCRFLDWAAGAVGTGDAGHDAAAGAPAWIMYTSGSTAEPKAVWQTHAGVVRHTDVYRDLIGLGPDDRLSLVTPFSLAASATALFGALLNGAAVCPFPLREQGVDRMVRWLADQRISVWHTVPSVLRQALRSARGIFRDSALRWVRLGGEAVLVSDVERWRREGPPGARLLHAYSSTETGLTCALVLGASDPLPAGRVPVGRPVAGVSVEVVDEEDRLVPAGTPGRIVVWSAALAPGYWGGRAGAGGAELPGETREGRRRWVTGDLGCLSAEGVLTHLGRMDHQVKVRGRRVDLAEVEAAVASIPGVREAAATVVEGAGGSPSLVALVVPEPGQDPGGAGWRRHWVEGASGVVAPDELVLVERLPLTPGGKLDRRALPGLAGQARRTRPATGASRPARDWFEKELAAIWRDVLQVPAVGRADDFFDLGGSSLHSAQVLARIEDRYGVALPPSILAQHPTVERLARVIGSQTVKQDGQPLVMLATGSGGGLPLFLAHGGKGDVAMYGRLSRRLADRTVGAFQSAGLAAESWPLMSVPAMARHYLAALRRVCPAGPVVLGGSCMGGLIALEMARQLRREGREVAEVVMIDTDYPAPAGRRLRRTERMVLPVRDAFRILRWGFLWTTGVARRRAWLPRYRRFVYAMNSRARRHYRLAPYPGRVTLFLATHSRREGPDLRRRMQELAAECRVVPIEGERSRLLLPPGVERLAAALGQVLAEADARGGGGGQVKSSGAMPRA